MKLIVGLGNPGRIYASTRHNIGFLVVKALAEKHRIGLKRDGGTSSLGGKGEIDGQDTVLAMPLTYMNLSGKAVAALIKKYKIDPDSLLVIHDDLELETGRLKIKSSGSSGGHRGLKSVIEALNSQEFARLRIGIGRPARAAADMTEYVLSPFTRGESQRIKEAVESACECCLVWLKEGVDKSMNIFNRKKPQY
ncbi:MAG: aminoacyl-tRNA hydrolase [Deltaproteobacteria bacterium]